MDVMFPIHNENTTAGRYELDGLGPFVGLLYEPRRNMTGVVSRSLMYINQMVFLESLRKILMPDRGMLDG